MNLSHKIIRLKVLAVFALLALFGCRQNIAHEDIQNLNGYWEIEKVIFPDGEKKEYKINETIDYFQINADSGIRKKMKPQFDGGYIQNGHSEKIMAKIGEHSYLEYKTDFAQWKEEIVSLSKEELVLKNENGIVYHYRRPIPFSIK